MRRRREFLIDESLLPESFIYFSLCINIPVDLVLLHSTTKYIMSFLGNLGKKAVEKAYDLASKVEGGRDYLTTAANTVNSLVKGKDAR